MFSFRMRCIRDSERVPVSEGGHSLFEGDSVHTNVGSSLLPVPLELHAASVIVMIVSA
jgi:hypothetical protein